MRFMNDYDIDRALGRYEGNDNTPNRLQAALTLLRLAEWTNSHSDGWAYWPKPARAAAKVMDLLEGDGTWAGQEALEEIDATDAELKKALAPIKAFLTRQGVEHFEVIE